MKKRLYMLVTSDKYELPLAVAGSVAELSKMTGINENTIYSALGHAKNLKRSRYVRVEVDE